VMPNYALERFVIAWQGRAAGAGIIVAPAAPFIVVPRPAQRGRLASRKTRMARFLMTLPTLLAGCAVPYQFSGSPQSATVIFSSDPDKVMVQAFADPSCNPNPEGTRLAYFFKDHFDRRTGTPKHVPAGRAFVFTFRSRHDDGVSVTFCESTRSFVPDAGQTYRAHFVLTKRSCDVVVTKRNASESGDVTESPVEVQDVIPACFNSTDG
jgi:hypothetical protein